MFFNSPSFPPFLAISLIAYWLVPARLRPATLLLAGMLFYLASDLRAFVIVAALAACTFLIATRIRRQSSRLPLIIGVVCLVAAFVVLKYADLLVGTLNAAAGAKLPLPHILMPLGISFFVFEFIHYLADVRKGKVPTHTVVEFFSFTFFYPTLISGPIKRIEPFLESLRQLKFQHTMLWTGILLILGGYLQKYAIADPLIPFTAPLSDPRAIPSGTFALAGLVLYSVRIYADFGALSNIAIGSAMLFGILVPRNFDNPYCSSDIAAFWRRWHMSLGSWVRDYLYIPLGGNRVRLWRTCINLIIVMFVVGIWHGANWTFAVWGLYHGVGLALHRLWRTVRPQLPFFETLAWRWLGVLTTFIFVTIGWAFFVADSLPDAVLLLSKAFHLS